MSLSVQIELMRCWWCSLVFGLALPTPWDASDLDVPRRLCRRQWSLSPHSLLDPVCHWLRSVPCGPSGFTERCQDSATCILLCGRWTETWLWGPSGNHLRCMWPPSPVHYVALTTSLLLVTGMGKLAGHHAWLLVPRPSTQLWSLPSTRPPRRHRTSLPRGHIVSAPSERHPVRNNFLHVIWGLIKSWILKSLTALWLINY